MAQRIAVLGASGYIGQRLVTALSEQGHQVKAVARRLGRLQKLALANVSLHEIDLFWPQALPALLEDVDTLYYLVHSMGESGDFVAHERQIALRTYPKRDFGLYLIDSHAGVETLISGGFEHQGLLFNYRFLRLLR